MLLVLFPPGSLRIVEKSETAGFLDSARHRRGYLLDEQSWLVFHIPPAKDLVKVVTNANAERDAAAQSPETYGTYAVEYEVLDGDGNVLRAARYVLPADVSWHRDPVTGASLPRHFYLGIERTPAAPRCVRVRLSDLRGRAQALRLRLVDRERWLRDVLVRVYCRADPPEYMQRYLWQRLPVAKRKELARANVYDIEFLTPAERLDLVRNRWVPLAPEGVQDEDFGDLTLYSVPAAEAVSLPEDDAAGGLEVLPGWVGVVPVPAAPGRLRVSLESMSAGAAPSETGSRVPLEATVTSHLRGESTQTEALESPTGFLSHEVESSGGFLVLSAPRPMRVRAAHIGTGGETDVTPERRVVSAYRGLPRGWIEYAPALHGLEASVWRIDVRRVFEDGLPDSTAAPLRYELLDAAGGVLKSGDIPCDGGASQFDDIWLSDGPGRVSDAVRRYVLLPAACALLRLECERTEHLVSVYVLLHAVPRRVRVPADDSGLDRFAGTQRTWFPVQPRNASTWIRRGRVATVRVQSRPLETVGEVDAEDTARRVTLASEGEPLSHELLCALGASGPGVQPYAPGRFVKLEPEAPEEHWFGGSPLAGPPRAIVLTSGRGDGDWRLHVDGRLHFETELAGRVAQFLLPPLPEGLHRLESWTSTSAEVYVSARAADGRTAFLKRSVQRLEKAGLRFAFTKVDARAEGLSARLYAPADQRLAAEVRVTIQGLARSPALMLDSWTHEEVVYEVALPPGEPRALPLTHDGPVLLEAVFFCTLGSDVPPGRYEIVVSLERSSAPCFFHLAREESGALESRRTFVEDAEDGEP
jgi:hypothetical protein